MEVRGCWVSLGRGVRSARKAGGLVSAMIQVYNHNGRIQHQYDECSDFWTSRMINGQVLLEGFRNLRQRRPNM
ncbi:hypothetical protein RSAG8_13493, partial [Rhizoctonia solani AG-8 WAC10335]